MTPTPKAPAARDLTHIQNLMDATKDIMAIRESIKQVLIQKLQNCQEINVIVTNRTKQYPITGFVMKTLNGSIETYNYDDSGFGFTILNEIHLSPGGLEKYTKKFDLAPRIVDCTKAEPTQGRSEYEWRKPNEDGLTNGWVVTAFAIDAKREMKRDTPVVFTLFKNGRPVSTVKEDIRLGSEYTKMVLDWRRHNGIPWQGFDKPTQPVTVLGKLRARDHGSDNCAMDSL